VKNTIIRLKSRRILARKLYTVLSWNKNLFINLKINRKRLLYQRRNAMSEHKFFINRRKGDDRRIDRDPCRNLPIDIYHRKRRKSTERRAANRSLEQDYFAFVKDDQHPQKH
jgi:hypothetical protein